jgi:hypothetical protein
MTDQRIQDPLAALVVPIADTINQHRQSPPYQRNLLYASWGAGLLAWCAYTGLTFGPELKQIEFPPSVLAGWAVCAGLGLLLLITGLRNTRGPRDVVAAVWWAAIIAGCSWLLGNDAYPDWGSLSDFLLKGCYLGMLASSAARFWINVRGMGMRRKPPRAHKAPRGKAGDATEAEAREAMRGKGGDRLPLDDKEF